MANGKFSAGSKKTGVDVYTLLEQRKQQNQMPRVSRPGAAPKAAPARNQPSPSRRQAAPSRPGGKPVTFDLNPAGGAPMTRPAQRPAPMPVPQAQPRRARNIKGTLIFYCSCLAFALVFYVCTFLGLGALRSWLVSYENAQPTVKCQEVFQELFSQPDWVSLYGIAGLENAGYEGADAFANHMAQRVGDQELSFLETSAGLSGDKKYIVRAGDDRIAMFTLEDRNQAETVTDVPDWQLKSVEFYMTQNDTVRILAEEGSTVLVNGSPLGEEAVIAIRNPKANDYLPTFAPAPKIHVLEVNGLMTQPTVEVLGPQGQAVEVHYDEAAATYTALSTAAALPQEREELALKAVQTYALFMSGKAGTGELSKYFDRNSDAYRAIVEADLNWVQKGSDYTFTDESVTDYRVYSDDIFSVRVSVNLNITRSEDGSIRENIITQSLFFTKNSSGNWVAFQMTAVDVNQYQEQVRLTFCNGSEILSSEFVDAQSAAVSCPPVTAPEGKTFAGWTVAQTDDQGQQVLRLVFTPDETGMAGVLTDTLEPMTLQPLFE